MQNRVSNIDKWLMLIMCGFGYAGTCMNIWMYYSYYQLMQEYFQATNTQMGYIGTITGLVMLLCWPLGGIVADKISMKKAYLGCMVFSVVDFVILAFMPRNFTLYLITVFLACFMMGVYYTLFGKIVKGVSTPETEGKNTGYFWALYAFAGSVIGAFGSYFVSTMGMDGWRPLMFMFIAIDIVCSLICIFKLDESKFNDWSVVEGGGGSKFQFNQVGKVLLMPEIWVAGLIYFTMLMITCVGIMAVSMMSTIYMVPLGIVTFIGIFRQYLGRVILSPLSGWAIDRCGSSMKVIRFFVGVTLVGFALFFIFPMDQEHFWVAIALVVACTIGYGMQSPCWMTPISEIKVPVAYHGTAVGLYNAIGCITDAFIYLLTGYWVDTYGNIDGNRISFAFVGVMLVLCIILTVIESKMIAKRTAKLAAQQ